MPLFNKKPALARIPRLSTFDNKCPIKFITDRLTLLRVWVCLKQCPLLGEVYWYNSWDMLQTLCTFQDHKHHQHYKHYQQSSYFSSRVTLCWCWLYQLDPNLLINQFFRPGIYSTVCTVQYSTVQYSLYRHMGPNDRVEVCYLIIPFLTVWTPTIIIYTSRYRYTDYRKYKTVQYRTVQYITV